MYQSINHIIDCLLLLNDKSACRKIFRAFSKTLYPVDLTPKKIRYTGLHSTTTYNAENTLTYFQSTHYGNNNSTARNW